MSKPTFSCSILAGIFGSHNCHFWAEANPRAGFVHRHQDGFAVSIWAGIIHEFLSESYLFPYGALHRLLGISGGNCTRSAGGNPRSTQEKHVIPEQQGCG
jgi:hypothetical protein